MTDYVKLPPDFKAKWIAALRSEKYIQAGGSLKSSGGFCCLGVACDISGIKWEKGSNYFMTPSKNTAFPDGEDLSADVMNSLRSTNSGKASDAMHKLADLNDFGSSFTQIANWIEENL